MLWGRRISMNRRSFLKRIGQTIAGVVAVPSLLKGKQKAIKPICTCPAPYKADVNNELVRHYDYCIFSKERDNFEPLSRRQNELDYIRQNIIEMFRPDSELVCIPQNIIRSEVEAEAYISKLLKELNFPEEYIK